MENQSKYIMPQSLAIVVIPAGCRHEPVDDRLQMFVTQGQVTPGCHADTVQAAVRHELPMRTGGMV